ncbi:hypothetical protein MNBD_NITROSPINAE02-502 [hydrothermal vent metagenome]|uniref:Terminase large subunit gp17-like C-terminal domain-containing protein n=1 Tax=hydrothermal vent metagenome TaxID=652676 RepID=A0A3B1C8W0_9ZZZZ
MAPTGAKTRSLWDWLADPACFAEAMLMMNGEPVRLDPWQASYLSNNSKLTNLLKSRRVGGSWIMTVRMFIRSQAMGRYSGIFVSMNREEARGKIDYADELHDSLPRKWRLKKVARSKDEIAFEDSRGRRSRLMSLAGKAPRGRGGDIGISELPHCIRSNEIYNGALHVTARDENSQLTIESTPLGKGGVFYDISRGAYSKFTRYEVPWWLCSALCVDVDTAAVSAPSMSTKDRVARYGSPSLKIIHASMAEKAFRQESELEFVEMENAAFPMELIMSCAEAECGESTDAKLMYRHLSHPPTPRDWRWLDSSRGGALFMGYDPGRKRDQAALVILDLKDGRFELRMTVAMTNVTFAVQRETLDCALKHSVTQLRIDSSGIGMDMAERMEREYRGQVKGVTFTAKSKELMIATGYNTFADGRIVIPAQREIIAELASIKEVISQSGSTIFSSRRSAGSHADLAWALLLAIESAREHCNHPVAEYQSVRRRSGYARKA